MMELRPAESVEQIEAARRLFREYQDCLGVPLCFQKFEEELASLPGSYAPPEGRLLLAYFGDDPVGCGALRKIAAGCCEMKRLYVRPNFRRLGIGRALALELMQEAEKSGYSEIRLDTLERLQPAVRMYISLGFKQIAPYYENPLEQVLYFSRELKS